MTVLAERPGTASGRSLLRLADRVAVWTLAGAVAATVVVPASMKLEAPPAWPVGTAALFAALASGAWLVLSPRSGRAVPSIATYPEKVVASVASASIAGFRDDRRRLWVVRFSEDGSERVMTEGEFQGVAGTARPGRTVAAVQQVGDVIYVQHIVGDAAQCRKHRTAVYHGGCGSEF